jgi:hypothetical protein
MVKRKKTNSIIRRFDNVKTPKKTTIGNFGNDYMTLTDYSGVTHSLDLAGDAGFVKNDADGKLTGGHTSSGISTVLSDGNILVGNAANVATSVNPSGDVDITNAGVFSIGSGVIVNADVNSSAAIAYSKLGTIPTWNQNTTGNAATVTTNANLTGDVTSSGNATVIASGVIVNADVNASAAIAYSKLGTIPTWNQNTSGSAASLSSTLAIGSGGTGQTGKTAAFDALSPTTTKGDIIASNGTDNLRLGVGSNTHVLTADSSEATGVKWASAGAGSSPWTTGSNVVNLNTDTDTVTIGSATAGGKLFIDGDADEIQLQIQSHSTQNEDTIVLENSSGTDYFKVSAVGHITSDSGMTMKGSTFTMGTSGVTANFLMASGGNNLNFRNTNANKDLIFDYPASNGDLRFRTHDGSSSTDRFRGTSAGYFGIGTTVPITELDVDGGMAISIVEKTGAYTATIHDHTIICDTDSGGYTITLPTAASAHNGTDGTGLILIIKNNGGTLNSLVIDGDGSETIDGSATKTISDMQSITIQSDGTEWFIISEYLPTGIGGGGGG